MRPLRTFVSSVRQALARARIGILTTAATYAASVAIGSIMVHTGNRFALDYRDQLVGQARQQDPASLALQQNRRVNAALLDFSRNLFLSAVPDTITGLAVILPYPLAAHRGWVGGIVSVDSSHESRLRDRNEAFYYLVTLILQLIPYTLAGGAGVTLGIANLRPPLYYRDGPWLIGLPREAILDVLRIYALIVPLFLIASLWEFLAR